MSANRDNGYTLAIQEIVYIGSGENSGVRLFYSRQDEGQISAPSVQFAYDFVGAVTFNTFKNAPQKEVQYRMDTTQYSNIRIYNENAMFATFNNNFVFVEKDASASSWVDAKHTVLLSSALSPQVAHVHRIENTDGSTLISIEYFQQSRLMRQDRLLIGANGVSEEIANPRTRIVFDAPYSTSWLQPSRIGTSLFFFNSQARDYTFFAAISEDEIARRPLLVSLVTEADTVAMARG
jgi:hypothetical protein